MTDDAANDLLWRMRPPPTGVERPLHAASSESKPAPPPPAGAIKLGDDLVAAVDVARQFHEVYERRAPEFGYETRPETRVFDPQSANGRLMVAVIEEVFGA